MKRCAFCKNRVIGTREQGFTCVFMIDPNNCDSFEQSKD